MASKLTKYDLEHVTDYLEFESFSHDLMSREGYKEIQPLGGFKDQGRDAVHISRSTGEVTVFAYSVREDCEKKLEEDLQKIQANKHNCECIVFVTTCVLTSTSKDKIAKHVISQYGWRLEIFDLERIATLVDNHHQDLKGRHLGIFHLSSQLARSEIENRGHAGLPAGLRDLPSTLADFRIVVPEGNLTFQTARTDRRVFEREATGLVISDLTAFGHALIVGPPDTGKTVIGFQTALNLELDVDKQFAGLQSYYCLASDSRPGEFLSFLDDRAPSLLLVDDAHEDEENACLLLTEWMARRKANSCERVYLLFMSQPFFSDEDEYRPINLFHQHSRVVKALPSDEEFHQFVSYLWLTAALGDDSAKVLQNVRKYTGNSPALAAIALGVALKVIQEGKADEGTFRKTLLSAVRQRYKLQDVETDAGRACIFSFYNIPIRIKALCTDSASYLMRDGFLIPSPTSRGEVLVFSRSISELWYEEKRLDKSDLADMLLEYLQHEESNYHQVLAGIQKSGHLRLFADVVNNGFQLLHQKIDTETDLHKAHTALECVSFYRKGLASQLIEQSLKARSLPLRLMDCDDAYLVSRYLNVITYHSRRVFVSGDDDKQTETVKLSLDLLSKIIVRPSTSLAVGAHICEAVARSDRDSARRLVASLFSAGSLSRHSGWKRESIEEALIFAGTISWFDRDHARQLFRTFSSNDVTAVLLAADAPKRALQLIVSIESLDHRLANTVLHNVLRSDGFIHFAQNLVRPPTSLYDIARLIQKVRYVSFRVSMNFAAQLLPFIQEAIQNDQRLSALGFLLNTLRRTNGKVAQSILASIKASVKLEELLSSETEPVRFAKTLLSIGTIDRYYAGNYVETLDEDNWKRLFQRCRNLTAVATVLRAVTVAALSADKTVERLLKSLEVKDRIGQLARDNTVARDLTNYAAIVAVACPLSQTIKTRLLSFISSQNFETAIEEEEDARRAGAALRAYVAAFPLAAYSFARGLMSKQKLLQNWVVTDDISASAFLLHSAAEVDGRLSDALGSLIQRKRALGMLQLEPRRTRVAEYLHAISLVAPVKAQQLTKELYGKEDPLGVIQDAGDLRGLVEILAAIRTSHSSFYWRWLTQLSSDLKKRNALKIELTARCLEESNLGILSILVSLVGVFDKALARELVSSLDYDWIREAGLRDNQITQVLQFITSVARYASSDDHDSFSRQLVTRLHSLLGDTLPRLAEVRSIRSLTSCLVELFRVGDSLGSSDIERRGWNSIGVNTLSNSLENSEDIVGCGLLSFLLTRLRSISSAASIMKEAKEKVLQTGGDHPIVPSVFALGLVGANNRELESRSVIRRLHELHDAKTWEVGFANWLAAQRALAESKPIQYPTIGRVAFEGKDGGHLLHVLRDEYKRAGNNLRFAFVLALVSQLGLQLLDNSDELVDALCREAAGRRRLEGRYWVQNLLDEFARELEYAESKLEERNVVVVAQCVRDLSPRIETVAGLEEDERAETILGTESSDLSL